MSVTVEDLQAYRTELATVDEDVIQAAIDEAEARTSRAQWAPAHVDYAVRYLALHLLALNAQADAAAAAAGGSTPTGGGTVELTVKWEQDGTLQRGYSDRAAALGRGPGFNRISNEVLESTLWGKRYLELLSLQFSKRFKVP